MRSQLILLGFSILIIASFIILSNSSYSLEQSFKLDHEDAVTGGPDPIWIKLIDEQDQFEQNEISNENQESNLLTQSSGCSTATYDLYNTDFFHYHQSTCGKWAQTVGQAIWNGVKTYKSCTAAFSTSGIDAYADFKCIKDCVRDLKLAIKDVEKIHDCLDYERSSLVARNQVAYSCTISGCGKTKKFKHDH